MGKNKQRYIEIQNEQRGIKMNEEIINVIEELIERLTDWMEIEDDEYERESDEIACKNGWKIIGKLKEELK